MTRVAILLNELPPYRRPTVQALGHVEGIELGVFLSVGVEPHRDWGAVGRLEGVQVEVVKNIMIPLKRRMKSRDRDWVHRLHIPIGTIRRLWAFRADVVISYEMGPRTILAILYARMAGAKLIIWNGLTPAYAPHISRLQRRLHPLIVRQAQAFIVYGHAAADYLISAGTDPAKIACCVQTADHGYWSQSVSQADKVTVREQFGLKDRVAIFVGHLVPRKGVDQLFEAWERLPAHVWENTSLLIVGSGWDEQLLRGKVQQLALSNVIFAGAQPPDVLRILYSVSDLLVFPTLLDTWGLVVNEAMAQGVPVLCSRYAGAAELIVEGVTGQTFDPEAVPEFALLLESWLDKAQQTNRSEIRSHISQWNYQTATGAFLKAINMATQSSFNLAH